MKRIVVLIICFSLLGGLLGGCQKPAQKPGTTVPESGLTTSDRRVIADKLSKEARQIEGVQNATVVLADNSGDNSVTTSPTPGQTDIKGLVVMVGLTTKPDSDETKVKNEVVSKLKAADGRVSNVLVTTDAGLVKRIEDVASGLLEGKPSQSMQDNIDKINKEIKKEKPVP